MAQKRNAHRIKAVFVEASDPTALLKGGITAGATALSPDRHRPASGPGDAAPTSNHCHRRSNVQAARVNLSEAGFLGESLCRGGVGAPGWSGRAAGARSPHRSGGRPPSHIGNAICGRILGVRLAKERKDSPRRIDAAVAGVTRDRIYI
jgi:hypothetical protein